MVDIPLQLWNNLRYAYGDQPDLIELVETLSENFERLYENEVCTFLFSLLSVSLFSFDLFMSLQWCTGSCEHEMYVYNFMIGTTCS